jgi:hypothetical protein
VVLVVVVVVIVVVVVVVVNNYISSKEWHVRGTGEMHVRFWWENLRDTENLEDLDIYGRIIIL